MSAGHNTASDGQLLSIVERIERLHEERKALADDVRDVYGEAKGVGFDPKIIRKLIAKRAKDPSALQEEESILELYEEALARAGTRGEGV